LASIIHLTLFSALMLSPFLGPAPLDHLVQGPGLSVMFPPLALELVPLPDIGLYHPLLLGDGPIETVQEQAIVTHR
jgi:hypothetical protein